MVLKHTKWQQELRDHGMMHRHYLDECLEAWMRQLRTTSDLQCPETHNDSPLLTLRMAGMTRQQPGQRKPLIWSLMSNNMDLPLDIRPASKCRLDSTYTQQGVLLGLWLTSLCVRTDSYISWNCKQSFCIMLMTSCNYMHEFIIFYWILWLSQNFYCCSGAKSYQQAATTHYIDTITVFSDTCKWYGDHD